MAADFVANYYYDKRDIAKLQAVARVIKFEDSNGKQDFEIHYKRR